MRLVESLLSKLKGKPALIGAKEVDDWPPHVFELLAMRFSDTVRMLVSERKPQGRTHFVGAMRYPWVEAALRHGAAIKTAELTVRDQDITHAFRPSKVRDGKAVDPLWYGRLPLHLRTPQAVLLRITKAEKNVKQELLLVYDSGSEKAKIVALIDYQGDGFNIVRTASRLIELDTLIGMVRNGAAVLIDGSL